MVYRYVREQWQEKEVQGEKLVKQRTGPWQRTEPDLVLLLFSLVAMPDHKPTSVSWLQGFCMHEAFIFSLSKVFFASYLCQPHPPLLLN